MMRFSSSSFQSTELLNSSSSNLLTNLSSSFYLPTTNRRRRHYLRNSHMYHPNYIIFLVLLLLTSFTSIVNSRETQQPPSIFKGPGYEQLFQVTNFGSEKSDKPFSLECEASGIPEPRYFWKKNGVEFDYVAYDQRITQQPKRGTLVFGKPDSVDEGLYQCFAKNDHGTSLSNAVFLRKAELDSFTNTQTEHIDVEEGQPLSLECNPPTGYPKPLLHWVIYGSSSTIDSINSSRLTVDPEGRLHFSNVTRQDQLNNADYACSVLNQIMSVFKIGRRFDLRVKHADSSSQISHPPIIHYVSPPNIPAIKGKPLDLHCIYGGTPLPSITWRRRSGSIEDNKYSFLNFGKTLRIASVEFKDEDIFECTASNGIGRQQTHAMEVTVQAAPYWRKSPSNTDAPENEVVKFECDADGNPKPKLAWFRNGVPLENVSADPRRTLEGNILTIHNLTKKDTAVFQCNASNTHGYAFKDFYLNVIALPPEFIDKPDEVTETVITANVLIKCKVFGAPKPEIKWMRNGISLTGGRYEILPDGLRINDVTGNDQGEYECKAKNRFGEDQAKGRLEVKQKTRITESPTNIEVQAGKTAVFRCNADADPSLVLEIIWSFKNVEIDFSLNQRMTKTVSNSLSIGRTIELDSGVYSCTARTKLDNATAEATLTVQDVPTPPKITNIQCNNLLAKVEWVSTGDRRAPILYYRIQYKTDFQETWEYNANEIPVPENSITVQMTPNSNYTFRLIAENKIGPSEPSAPSEPCKTQQDVPFSNPNNVQGHGNTPNNLIISWTAMTQSEHHAPGFFYKVFWKRSDLENEPWNHKTINDWTQTKLVIDNTPTFKPYRIKVEAHNSRGQSLLQANEIIGWSGENRPTDAPKNLINIPPVESKSSIFKWEPVSLESIRGHFKGYKIQTWTAEESEDQCKEVNVPSNVTHVRVEALKPNSLNYVQVLAYNQQYNGPASNRVEVRTPEGVPGPVAEIGAVPMGSSALLVYWEKPVEINGELLGYSVFYEEMKGTRVESKTERKPRPNESQTRVKLGHLKPDTKYRITVQARTKPGLGEPNFIEKETRNDRDQISAPGIPKFHLSRLPYDNGKVVVRVTWLPNIESGRPGSDFFVQYRKKGEQNFQSTPVSDSLDPIPIEGLELGETYEFRVVSQDGEHTSASEMEEVTTSGIGGYEVAEGSTSHFNKSDWFIGMICAISLAILSAIMVCIVKRNRGGKYTVQDKEQRYGRNPLDYHNDSGGFEEFSPKSVDVRNPFQESNVSYNGDDYDDESYEGNDNDTSKFEEDGSFIGEYSRRNSYLKTRKSAAELHNQQNVGNPTFV